MPQILYTVDAFTDTPFSGNPAGVCPLEAPRDEGWMASVAREMNLSETAFLLPRDDGLSLRWFTPAVEVDLCGHATLASAHILWQTGALPANAPARFHTLSGLLTARRQGGRIEMDFPAEPPVATDPPPDLLAALGTEPRWVGKNRLDYLVEAPSAQIVRELRPDIDRLTRLGPRGVIVTARSDMPEYDFISRCFFPSVGIDEDPVTGSAHCALGPFWAERLGKTELTGYQASSRGGTVWVRSEGDRVFLGGHAVTVMRGELMG